nr:integrase, catalytic region, zinc finger, CCHC-type, peptidase aspartic, catalytic [Tanacetum cinerariifolium]
RVSIAILDSQQRVQAKEMPGNYWRHGRVFGQGWNILVAVENLRVGTKLIFTNLLNNIVSLVPFDDSGIALRSENVPRMPLNQQRPFVKSACDKDKRIEHECDWVHHEEHHDNERCFYDPILAYVTKRKRLTSNALHNAIMEAGGKDHPPMLAPGIDNDIYSIVDACPNACEMWKAIERFYKMMNELVRNQCDVTNHQVNVQFLPQWQRFVTLVKQSQELKTVSYHKLYDILKQHQNEVNEIRAERLARTANPLSLVAQQQPVYHPQNHHTHYTQNYSTRSQQAATRNRSKAIVNSPPPIYDQEPTMVAEDDEIGTGYDNQRIVNVARAKENVVATCSADEDTIYGASSSSTAIDDDEEVFSSSRVIAAELSNTSGEVSNPSSEYCIQKPFLQKNTLAEYMILSGADNRPPMLDKDLYDSWKSRMELYMKNKEHGRMILESIENSPLIWPTIEENEVTRTKKYAELSVAEKIQADCDMKATNIILQGYDPIACLNKAMTFLTTVASSRNVAWYKEKAIFAEAQDAGQILDEEQLAFLADPGVPEGQDVQIIIPENAAFQTEDLDTYDSDCDDISNAKVVLIANISNYGSDVISELLKSQNAHNDLLKRCSQLEKHYISLESSIKLNQEIFQKDESCDNQNALAIPEYFQNNDLKAQLQDKDTTICKLKNIIKSMREKSKDENVNFDYVEIKTKNVELENSVAKLISENERLCNAINHVKQLKFKIKNDLQKIKGKEIVDNAAQKPSANTVVPGMFKLYLVPLVPKLLQNREAHIDYLKSYMYMLEIHALMRLALVLKRLLSDPKTMSRKLGLKCSTSNYRSNPTENKKNDRISQTPSRNMKKKVEARPRKVNKKNRVIERMRNVDVKQSQLNANSKFICATCKKSMFDGVHDMCLLDFVKNVNSRAKSAKKHKKQNIWKPQVVQIVLWYLDSGCSKHMTGNRSQLINFVSKFLGTLRFGNDHILRIIRYGDYQLGNVTISRVYYVEGLGHNLFSVGQFCDADLEVAFRKNTCFIGNLEGVDLISESRDTNLYTISLDDMFKTSPIGLLSKASKTKSWLWHHRLSHLNFGTWSTAFERADKNNTI